MSTGTAVPTYCDAAFTYLGGTGTPTPVLDGRAAGDQLSWEDCGFQLLEHASVVAERPGGWRDEGIVNSVHAPEIEALALELSGARHALVYPTIIRSPEAAKRTPDYAPITLVHSDFTEDYRAMVGDPERPYRTFIEPLLATQGLTQADLRSASRLLMLQFWRNTGPVEADYPLAFCDPRRIGAQRLSRFVVPEYGGQKLAFEAMGFSAPPAGQHDPWYTFPRMHDCEVVALRTYDSLCVDEGRPFFTPHSAFRDPHVDTTPDHARESVEMRALCVWTE